MIQGKFYQRLDCYMHSCAISPMASLLQLPWYKVSTLHRQCDQLFGSHCTTVYQKMSYLNKQSLNTVGGEVGVEELAPAFACDNLNITFLGFLSVPMPIFSIVASPNAMSCSSPEFPQFWVF